MKQNTGNIKKGLEMLRMQAEAIVKLKQRVMFLDGYLAWVEDYIQEQYDVDLLSKYIEEERHREEALLEAESILREVE